MGVGPRGGEYHLGGDRRVLPDSPGQKYQSALTQQITRSVVFCFPYPHYSPFSYLPTLRLTIPIRYSPVARNPRTLTSLIERVRVALVNNIKRLRSLASSSIVRLRNGISQNHDKIPLRFSKPSGQPDIGTAMRRRAQRTDGNKFFEKHADHRSSHDCAPARTLQLSQLWRGKLNRNGILARIHR